LSAMLIARSSPRSAPQAHSALTLESGAAEAVSASPTRSGAHACAYKALPASPMHTTRVLSPGSTESASLCPLFLSHCVRSRPAHEPRRPHYQRASADRASQHFFRQAHGLHYPARGFWRTPSSVFKGYPQWPPPVRGSSHRRCSAFRLEGEPSWPLTGCSVPTLHCLLQALVAALWRRNFPFPRARAFASRPSALKACSLNRAADSNPTRTDFGSNGACTRFNAELSRGFAKPGQSFYAAIMPPAGLA